MPENVTLRCQECGQGFLIALTDSYNLRPVSHCPICGGTSKLAKAAGRFEIKVSTGLHYYFDKAACFEDLERLSPGLVPLLFQEWQKELGEQGREHKHQRFIDYLKEQTE